jgi:hypothetical protein
MDEQPLTAHHLPQGAKLGAGVSLLLVQPDTAAAQSSGIDPEHDTPANTTKEEVVDFKNANVLLTNMVNFAK